MTCGTARRRRGVYAGRVRFCGTTTVERSSRVRLGRGACPGGRTHRRDGRFPACGGRGRPHLPSRRGERPTRVPATLRRRTRPDRRSGPVPDTRDGGGPELLGGPRCASAARQPGEHLPRTAHGPGAFAAVQRRSDTVDAPGCAAAEQGAHDGTPQTGRAPRQGLGGSDRAGHPALAARGKPLVSVLWGRDARNLRPFLDDFPAIESAHPSPMSADRGFFGSRPFSRTNELLLRQGAQPVDWQLP